MYFFFGRAIFDPRKIRSPTLGTLGRRVSQTNAERGGASKINRRSSGLLPEVRRNSARSNRSNSEGNLL